jgi:hypothetical protein
MDRITASLKYHGLEISGTSGRIKNPLMATGKEITPSMIKSLVASQYLDISIRPSLLLTIASPWTLLVPPDDTLHPWDIQKTYWQFHCWCGKYKSALPAHLICTRSQLYIAFQGRMCSPRDLSHNVIKYPLEVRSSQHTDKESQNVKLSWAITPGKRHCEDGP